MDLSQPDLIAACAAACSECYAACREAEAALAGSRLANDHAAAVGLLRDCAELVDLAANMLLRRSAYWREVGALAQLVCTRCADECDRLGDKRLLPCSEAARRCADSCSLLADEQ